MRFPNRNPIMKAKHSTFQRNAFVASIAVGLSVTAHAQQFWSGTGTWNITNTNWGAATGGPYSAVWGNTTASIATFEGTAGTVTVGENVNADALTFNVTGYELTAASAVTLTGSGATNYNLLANVTATIGANVTLQSTTSSPNWNIAGGNRNTSILNLNGIIRNTTANNSAITDATINVNSTGQLICGSSIIVGTATNNSGSILNIAGTVSIGTNNSNFILNNTGGISANSTITLASGGGITFTDATNAGGIRFGATGAINNPLTQNTSTLNLDGGTATVNRVYIGSTGYTGGSSLTAVVNFNGGTLKALRNNTTFFQGFTQAITNSSSTGAFVKAGGANFDSNGFAITVGQVLQSGVAGPTLDGGLTLNDTAVTKGTLTLSGANTYTGDTVITAGTLAIGNVNALQNSTLNTGASSTGRTVTFTVAGSNTYNIGGLKGADELDFGANTVRVGANAANTEFSGALKGSGALTKVGAGSLTLSGNSITNFSGATNVNAGTLVVNGNISTSNVTVANGATIGGSGTVGALTINAGGFVNPGNSPGILNTGDYNQAGTLVAEITGLTAGTQHDQINVTGTVTLSGALSILATGGTYAANNIIFLILNDDIDAVNGTFSGLAQGATAATFGGFDWIISYEANSTGSTFLGGNDVALMAIPESSTALLGGLSTLLLLRRRRLR
jgi:autotransporter-associated beta strand protein